MKVILTDFVQSLGSPGDEVDVAPGYARNYLIPKNFGFEATVGNCKTYDNNLKQRARKIAKIIKGAEAQKNQVDALGTFVFTRKAGEDGKLFGSVTSADIEKMLAGHGFNISKRQIDLRQPIKTISETDVLVKIHTDVTATVRVVIEAEAVEKVEDEDEENLATVEAEMHEEETSESETETESETATEKLAE